MEKNIKLMDESELKVGLVGNSDSPTIMLPVAKESVCGQEAEHLKLWGVDPESGKHFIEGLMDKFRILYFDYEGHRLQNPNPDNLTPEHIVKDLLTIADEMNVKKFSYYGYSWLALVGLQLAIRTDRLESLIMGGFPPIEGPYKEMMAVTYKTYEQALGKKNSPDIKGHDHMNPEKVDWDNIQVKIDTNQTKQFVTLYENLMDFDDREIQHKLSIPRLAFAGEKDTIVYGENFGSVTVDIIGILQKNKEVLEHLGWDIEIIKGNDMDHTRAMQPVTVVSLIKHWLIKCLNKSEELS
ncbi:pimeloyl-ACP methyl ester carboxylesterase [Paenibacillus sp. JGP012]|uniref:alpha/beta fold hydrolase n=1 Tax=Paenibacillus sp. JGP012 TaxID=2735914 RepID=UPI00160FD7F4|nr:alpha/beta hydrolase [Paenibacillus sp. JGP012]MBB6020127.1 pimeloyl-ACP methyl ester carboxylesterase [Paenibacillus sp. JGP012]